MKKSPREIEADYTWWRDELRRRDIGPSQPVDPAVALERRRQSVADEIEDAEAMTVRYKRFSRVGVGVSVVGATSVVGSITLGGFAAVFNLGLAPLVLSGIIVGVLVTILGFLVWLVANGASVFDNKPLPADELRRLRRKQRDLYLHEGAP